MSDVVISIENLSKSYRLGVIGSGTLKRDFSRWWAHRRGKPDPSSRIDGAPTSRHNGEVWALRDIDLEVSQGAVLGIIGRNGAGKSTLLKIISRITAPTTGEVRILGRTASLLEVGTGFHPELTGRENVYLNGAILGMTRKEVDRKFDEIVDFSGVETYIDTPVKRYSSGMNVRLAFAVAAHLEPEILIIDEVLAVGDIAFQKRCLGKIGNVTKTGRTVLFVSHNMGSIQSICSEALLLEGGDVAMRGEPGIVTEKYLAGNNNVSGFNKPGFDVNLSLLTDKQHVDIQITRIDLVNPAQREHGPRTGDPLEIFIGYETNKTLLSPGFVVQIRDWYENELIRLSSMPISGYEIDRLYASGTVRLTIHELPLVAGRYNLSIGYTRERIEWLIRLDNIVSFDVSPKDVYGSGILMDRSRGAIIVAHDWDHSASLSSES